MDLRQRVEAQLSQKRDKIPFKYTRESSSSSDQIVLPENVRLNRSEWKAHPRWSSNSRLLLRSHQSFRQTSFDILDTLWKAFQEERVGPSLVSEVSSYFDEWMSNLSSHGRYEEAKLFPYLASRNSLDLNELMGEHEALHAAERVVRDALSSALLKKKQELIASMPIAIEAYIVFDHTLLQHLQHEENIVVPLLLNLSSEEFQWYYNARSARQALQFPNS